MTFDLSSVAQTNLRLYRQMSAAGASRGDLQQIVQCYTVACRILGGQFRSSGKTLVDHHVGTASLIYAQTSDVDLACLGVLHASFTHGVFPDGKRGLTPRHEAWLSAEVPDQVSSLVKDYGQYRSFRPDLAGGRVGEDPGPARPEVLVARLANQIDDAMDGADLIGGKQAYKVNDVLQAVEDASRARGLPVLAEAAHAVRTDEAAAQFADGLGPMKVTPFRKTKSLLKWRRK